MFKYYIFLKKGFNISPLDTGGAVRLLLYAVWGFNVLIFLSHDFSDYSEKTDSGKPDHSIYCTVLKKAKSVDIHIVNFKFVGSTQFVVILPQNYELPANEVTFSPNERSPPDLHS
jgi:hypothetical protein